MMIFSLVAMIGLDKCCMTSACLQWLCHSGERIVARGPLVSFSHSEVDILLQTQCLSLNFDAKIYISAVLWTVHIIIKHIHVLAVTKSSVYP